MTLAIALLPDRVRLARLQAAARLHFDVQSAGTIEELTRVCETRPVGIAVVDFECLGERRFDALRQLRRRFPRLAMVLYSAVPPVSIRDIFDAGRFGFDGLILADREDDPRTLLATIEQAQARGVLGILRRAIGAAKPTVRDATLSVVARAHQRLSPLGLATLLGISRRTLAQRLAEAAFPGPQRLIAWGRLIVAAQMMEDATRSVDGIARALDFPSGSAFRNSCQRYLRAAPHEIRARGGARYVISAFVRRVSTRARPSAGTTALRRYGGRLTV